MAIYTQLFAALSVPAGSGVVALFTAPEVGTVVLRDIIITPTQASIPAISVYTVAPGGAAVYIDAVLTPANFAVRHWQGRQVMTPAGVLYCNTGDGSLTARVSGYLLGV